MFSGFIFPNDTMRKEVWSCIIRKQRKEPYFKPHKNARICSVHFCDTDVDISKTGLRRLKVSAIPRFEIEVYENEERPLTPAQISQVEEIDLDISDLNSIFDSPRKLELKKRIIRLENRQSDAAMKYQDSPSSGNEIKVFCPKCNTEVPHTAEGMQQDQKKILIAKVYHYFEHEFEELKKMYGDLDLTPLSKFRQRTALATGVSETTVLQILKEEEERNAEKLQEPSKKRRRARKRSRQTDSSSEEDSSDDNVDDGGQSSIVQVAQNEPEIETLVVKLEPPEHYKEQAQTDPISTEVKEEPPDVDVDNANETLALNEPTGTKSKARKIPRSDVTSTREHTRGESSSTAAASSVRLTEELDESGLLGESEVKVENIEIGEEGFS